MWVKSLVFREAHDGRRDEYHLLLGGIASFLFLMLMKHKDTHTHMTLLTPLILSRTTHSGFNKTPHSWAGRIFSAVIGSPGSVAPSYKTREVEGCSYFGWLASLTFRFMSEFDFALSAIAAIIGDDDDDNFIFWFCGIFIKFLASLNSDSWHNPFNNVYLILSA